MHYDLIVVGGGPGGYHGALCAAENGLKTALVEGHELGGTCLNRGCIPTKFLLGATDTIIELESQKRLRLARGEAVVDLDRLQARKTSIISSTRKQMQARLEKSGVDVFKCQGSLGKNGSLLAGKEHLGFDHLILATGSRSGFPEDLKPDHDKIMTSTDVLEMREAPKTLAVVGAGAVGLELAQIFSRFGSRITLIEAMNRIAPLEDEQVSSELSKYFKREKWIVRTGVKVLKILSQGKVLKIQLDSNESVEAEKCLLALGRLPNSEGINLEESGAQTFGPGWIRTDKYLQAAEKIYAVGDVNGRSMYAHAATHQAEYVVKRILGKINDPYIVNSVPTCLYGGMEVIRTGLTQRDLMLKDGSFSVSAAQLAANPIAQSHGRIQGFIKVFWSRDRVVGITGTGHGLSGLVTLAQVITDQQWTREEVKKYIFAHPTIDEALQEALLAPLVEHSQ
ncbi:dihydrolipoyl dehydrogenase family protein [Desulfonatronovibrio magnus]|uniref:dihydrolipoyl dehydrogenase family protein n=1 Tax=Desulfonatronovibrio magnus TaxID=698827 RepID=UPI0005EBD6AF|nr:NAD(P)/FAD-dependent oxidoreductase [Desulfonatronovibrio magnus]